MCLQFVRVDRSRILSSSEPLYIWALVSQTYFLVVVLRDSATFCYHLVSESLVGFWDALWMHLVSLPLDCVILFELGVQGYRILEKEETHECELSDIECGQFVRLFRANILASFIYIFFNVGFKLLVITFFMCCADGFEYLTNDMESEQSLDRVKA